MESNVGILSKQAKEVEGDKGENQSNWNMCNTFQVNW